MSTEEDAMSLVPSAEMQFRSDMTVDLVDSMARDADVVSAARVSTQGQASRLVETELAPDSGESKLILYLMRARHGSPFEHSVMKFYIEAPIFVWREIMRHRIASYNEESGRYRQLRPTFYVPARDRLLQQIGKPGHYSFIEGTPEQVSQVGEVLRRDARITYAGYEALLASGVAREVARMGLPLNLFSSGYMTLNARSLMNFLSLRTIRPDATYPSYPQREIAMVADQVEGHWQKLMPLTHAAFESQGRVAP